MSRRQKDAATAQLLATVDSESRSYTDRAAKYPRARQYQQARDEGVSRRLNHR